MRAEPVFNVNKLFLKFFGCYPLSLAKKVVIAPFINPGKVKTYFTLKSIRGFSGKFFAGFTGNFKDVPLTFIKTGIGSFLVRDCLFFLERAGVKEAIFIGTVGALDNFKIGDLIFVRRASADIKGNQYYQPQKKYIKNLQDYFSGVSSSCPHQCNMYSADVFSVSSFFEETAGFLKDLKKSGFSAVDLELSAFYEATGKSGIKAAALCAVSDLPLEKPLGEVANNERQKVLDSLNFSLLNILNFMADNDQR